MDEIWETHIRMVVYDFEEIGSDQYLYNALHLFYRFFRIS